MLHIPNKHTCMYVYIHDIHSYMCVCSYIMSTVHGLQVNNYSVQMINN